MRVTGHFAPVAKPVVERRRPSLFPAKMTLVHARAVAIQENLVLVVILVLTSGPVSYRIVSWDCHGDAITSFIGYTRIRFPGSPTMQFETTPVQCHAQPRNCQFFWYPRFLVYFRTYTPKVPIRHLRNERETVLSQLSQRLLRVLPRTGRKNWPIAARHITSNNPRNNCGTHFGSSSFLISKVANFI